MAGKRLSASNSFDFSDTHRVVATTRTNVRVKPTSKRTPEFKTAVGAKGAPKFDLALLENIRSPSSADELLVALHRAMLRNEPPRTTKDVSLTKLVSSKLPSDKRYNSTKKRLTNCSELQPLREKLHGLDHAFHRLARVEDEYEKYVKVLRSYDVESRKIALQCRALCASLEKSQIGELYRQIVFEQSGIDSTKTRVYALAGSNLTLLLLHYRNLISAPSSLLDSVVSSLVFGSNPFQYLPDSLENFVMLLQAKEIDSGARIIHNAIPRKSSSKTEFFKRRTFEILVEELQSSLDQLDEMPTMRKLRNPNKETAAVVNVLLRLSGRVSVSANDISQMNKANRRKYFVEKVKIRTPKRN